MPYDVTITKRATGESRTYGEAGSWDDVQAYLWSEGNNSCDCSRAEAFAECAGEDDPCIPCSDDQYTVTVRSGGIIVYEDGPETNEKPASA